MAIHWEETRTVSGVTLTTATVGWAGAVDAGAACPPTQPASDEDTMLMNRRRGRRFDRRFMAGDVASLRPDLRSDANCLQQKGQAPFAAAGLATV